MTEHLFELNSAQIRVGQYMRGGDPQGLDAVRVYRSSPDRVTLQIRGRKQYANSSLSSDEARKVATALNAEATASSPDRDLPHAFSQIKITDRGGFEGVNHAMGGCRFSASFSLFLIRHAWERGCRAIEVYADGFGAGQGTYGDWSAIRDSSNDAKNKMLEASLNFLFPEG